MGKKENQKPKTTSLFFSNWNFDESSARLPHHHAIASPHQMEHTLNLNKLHEYFVFVKEVVSSVSVEEDASATVAHAVDLLLMVVMECPLTLGLSSSFQVCFIF